MKCIHEYAEEHPHEINIKEFVSNTFYPHTFHNLSKLKLPEKPSTELTELVTRYNSVLKLEGVPSGTMMKLNNQETNLLRQP